MKIEDKQVLFRNLKYAFASQIISLLLSIMMSLIVPQVLGIKEFGYWQLFIFYTGYSGFLHLGLNDGIYLKEGGKIFDELDFDIIGSQFKLAVIAHSILSIIIIWISVICIEDNNRQVIWILVAIYIPLYNATGFLGYIFQAVNETKLYSLSVILDKLFFICAVIYLIISKQKKFEIFIIMFIIGKILCLIYCLIKARKVVNSKFFINKSILNEAKMNITIGMNLMISNIAGALILGVGRIISDKKWGIEEFAKISFAILLTNLFLTFIAQISMVLFPTLRKLKKEDLKTFYIKSRKILNIILPGVLLGYMPIKNIIQMILPQYKESLEYLIFLLPLCIYDGKVNLLCNTYFKVMRKEKWLLKINIVTLIITVFFSVLGIKFFNDIYVIIIAMLLATALRSILAEVLLCRLLNVKIGWNILVGNLLVVIFIGVTNAFKELPSFCMYGCIYILYILSIMIKNYRRNKI